MEIKFENIKSTSIATIVPMIIVTVCNGILFLFCFKRELFLNMDFFKLVLLSLSFACVIWLFNSFISILLSQNKTNNEIDIEKESVNVNETNYKEVILHSLISSVLTFPVLLIPSIIKLFFDINTKTGILISIIIEVIVITYVIYINRNKK